MNSASHGPFSIRSATIEDIVLIRNIAYATWPVSYRGIITKAQIAYMLEGRFNMAILKEQFDRGHRFALAYVGSNAVGLAGYEHDHQKTASTRLHKLYVLPAAQGSGAGAALLAKVEFDAKATGDGSVELNVNKHNPAVAFYSKHGYRVLRDEVIEIGHGFVMDDHVMMKHLSSPHLVHSAFKGQL